MKFCLYGFCIFGVCKCLTKVGNDCTNMKNSYSLCQNKYHSDCVHVFNTIKACSIYIFCNSPLETILHKKLMWYLIIINWNEQLCSA